MLEGLDDINWAELHHGYGPATDVPGLIRNLLSGDAEALKDALGHLRENIWHQGTVYEATAHAVPFLIELLESDAVLVKTEILGLLEAIAMGNSGTNVHVRQEHQRSTPEVQARITQELSWVRAAHEAVRRGVPTYVKLFGHADKRVRMYAAWVLRVLPEDAVVIAPEMRAAIEREADPPTQAQITLCLGELVGSADGFPKDQRQDTTRFLGDVLHHTDNPTVRLAAAISLAWVAQEDAPPQAMDTLIDGLVNWERYHGGKVIMQPFYGVRPAMYKLGPERGIPALMCALLAIQDENTAHDIGRHMLLMAFGPDPMKEWQIAFSMENDVKTNRYWRPVWISENVPPRQAVTDTQRAVLQALLNSDPFWKIRSNLLTVFGVPDTRDELRDFLSRLSRTRSGS